MEKSSRDGYLKVPDIAAKFNVHPRTVWDWVYRGLIPHYKLGRSVYFKWCDVEAEMNRNRFVGYRRVPAASMIQTPTGPQPRQTEMDYGTDLASSPVRISVADSGLTE